MRNFADQSNVGVENITWLDTPNNMEGQLPKIFC